MPVRLLIVEDNEVDVDIIREVMADLPDHRYELVAAGTMAEARERLEADAFAAILLDLNLPDSAGLRTVEAIRAIDPATTVIVLTGVEDEQLAAAAIRAGAQDYMVKGVTDGRVMDRVLRYSAERQETLNELAAQRRDAEAASANFARLIDSSADGMVVVDAGGLVQLVNPAAERILGRPKDGILGRPLPLPLATDASDAVEITRPAGPPLHAEVSAVEVTWQGETASMITLHDVTARRLAELAIRESEERYRELYTKTPVMMHSINGGGRLISVSDYWLEHLGYERDEVIGRPSTDFLTEESRRYAAEVVLPDFLRTGACKDVPYQMVKKNGEVIDVELSAIAEGNENGFVRSLAVLVDVTERKRAQDDLVRTNRALRTISQGNQMLVRATSEAQLLFDMCRIAVEEGGYRMAWVGFAEDDAAKTVRPVAHYGYEKGYLNQVRITWADDEYGRGPTGRAIRTGRTVVERDLAGDGAVGPWREEAASRGFRSLVALPLRDDARIFGTMNVYAGAKNAFTAHEIEILEEMANDLAYGLIALRDSAERRRAEGELRERERELATMMANLPGMAYRCRNEPDWPMEFVSEGAKALTGFEPGALVGQDNLAFVDLIHQDDRDRVWDEVQAAVGERRPFQLSYRLRTSDGTEKRVQEHGQGIWAADGSLTALEGIVLDVTKRHRVEEALMQSEERYQRAVLAGGVGVWDWELATDAIYVAPNLKAILGYADEEIPNRIEDWGALVHPDDRDRVMAAARDCIEGRTDAYEIEHRMVHKDGSDRWFLAHGRAIRDDAGKAVRLSGTDTHITARKKTEEELRILTAAVEQSPIMVVISDTDTRIEYVNRAFTEVTGYTLEDAIGAPTSIMASGETPRERYDALWATLRVGENWRGRFLNRRKDGSLYWAETVISPIKDVGGTVMHYVAVQEDVTDRLQTEQELAQMQKMESLGNLAGGIAHDLNNMLQPILSLTALSIEDLPEDSPLRENLEMVTEAGERAKTLVQQILSFSRREETKREVVDISDFMKRWMGLLRSSVPTTVTLEPAIEPDTGTVDVDQAQLGAVLMNLASNAVDAMEGRVGRLAISLARTTIGDGTAAAEGALPPSPYARLTVTDTGHGMDEKTMHRIFEPFFTTKEVGEGTGLGLATCYGIVTRHGGTIRVSSEVGVGTTFDVFLPLVSGNAAEPGPGDTRASQ